MPRWERASRRAGNRDEFERAILEIEYVASDGRHWLDVTVRHPAAGDTASVRAAARKDGEASRRAERAKHERYPGAQLTLFAVESPGRLGAEARLWLLCHACELPPDQLARELTRAYKSISCAVEGETAWQLRRAAGNK